VKVKDAPEGFKNVDGTFYDNKSAEQQKLHKMSEKHMKAEEKSHIGNEEPMSKKQ
jgi:uncharacterized protein YajQ (UPF0234 family)